MTGLDQPKIVPLPRPSLLCSIMTVSCLSASCFGEFGIHQLILRERMHVREHSLSTGRTINHQHAHAFFRRHLMRNAGRDVHARAFPGVEQLIADLKVRAAHRTGKTSRKP